MKKAIIMMIVVFALVVWPFSGVWQLLSGIIGGGVRESFIYPIYGGIILLSGIIVVCTRTHSGRNQIVKRRYKR